MENPLAGFCHVAWVESVAVRTWPREGAVAAATFTVVVAELSASLFALFPVVSWFRVGKVQLARFPLAGVPSSGAMKVGPEARATAPEPVVPSLKSATLGRAKLAPPLAPVLLPK